MPTPDEHLASSVTVSKSAPSRPLRQLDPERIVATAVRLQQRIQERFPNSSLGRIAQEVRLLTEEVRGRSVAFDTPNMPLRIGIGGLVCLIVAFLVTSIISVRHTEQLLDDLSNFVQFLEAALGGTVFIGAAILYLVSLENRIKRARAIRAIHELRALAHIIDMHQLTKDPERMHSGPATPSSPQRTMTPFELSRYLDYCVELLAILGKIGALYAQYFPDPEALEAVEQVETLTTGLSRSIWQKMMILDRMLETIAHATTGALPKTS